MLVLGLVSGGKDSCFNLLHCQLNGHQLVALGNLVPTPGVEELDSPLYQSVGQTSVKYIAEAIGVPLYTQTINGLPKCQTADYRHQGEDDETEDLAALVETVLKSHPDIKALSSGAVLSNYQRVRVEHICERFGLISLSYLWQRDQTTLLDEMYHAGMHSMIIKIAGAGLRLRHLGLDVTSPEMRNELQLLKEKFGLHPAGEGGEYETYTTDCPLFKKRINILLSEKVLSSKVDDGFSTVGYLRIKDAATQTKTSEQQQPLILKRPPLFDEDSLKLEQYIRKTIDMVSTEPDLKEAPSESPSKSHIPAIPSISVSDTTLVIGSITATDIANLNEDRLSKEITDCLDRILQIIKNENDQRNQCFELTGISLFMSTDYMRRFADVNKAYKACLDHIIPPPVRAAVSVVLPDGIGCVMEAVAHDMSASDRKGLHVQGLSYWAPACIGPYSQAISVFNHTFISGQIAMDPANLNLLRGTNTNPRHQLVREAILSAQHATRIYQAINNPLGEEKPLDGWIRGGICWLYAEDNWHDTWTTVRYMYKQWLEENQNQNILFVASEALPKNASVEWQILCSRKTDSENMSNVNDICVQMFDAIDSVRTSSANKEKWNSIRVFCRPGTDCALLSRTLEKVHPDAAITVITTLHVANLFQKASIGVIFSKT